MATEPTVKMETAIYAAVDVKAVCIGIMRIVVVSALIVSI